MQDERKPPPPARASRVRRYLPWLGLLLLAWVLSRFDLASLGAAFARIRVWSLLSAALLFAGNLALKSWRWQRMLRVQGLHLPAQVALAAFFSSQFYGQVTLGRLGELYRAEALIERGVPAGIALSSSIYDRLLDLAAVLLLAATLSALVVGNGRAAVIAAVGMLVLSALGVFVLQAPSLAALPSVARLRSWLASRRGTRGALGLLAQLVSGLGPLMRPAFLLEATLWTAAAWYGYFVSLWLLADGMGIVASRSALTAGAALGALSALLPVTISGLGAREVIFMNVLALEHVDGSRAVVLSLVHLCVMSAVAIVLGLCGIVARQRQQRRYAATPAAES